MSLAFWQRSSDKTLALQTERAKTDRLEAELDTAREKLAALETTGATLASLENAIAALGAGTGTSAGRKAHAQLEPIVARLRDAEAALDRVKADEGAVRSDLGDRLQSLITASLSVFDQEITRLDRQSGHMIRAAAEALTDSDAMAGRAQAIEDQVSQVAGAAQELSGAIGEIGHQVTEASKAADSAASGVLQAESAVGELVKATDKIQSVLEFIRDVADQTNLLALNATIEAARAGEAGRGFAVVANEVKNLANQTAQATEEISGAVEAIRTSSTGTVEAIHAVGDRVRGVNERAMTIASAVEEQSSATQEIARGIDTVRMETEGFSESTRAVREASKKTSLGADGLQAAVAVFRDGTTDLSQSVSSIVTELKD